MILRVTSDLSLPHNRVAFGTLFMKSVIITLGASTIGGRKVKNSEASPVSGRGDP
jgi:hypothetical protein